MSRTTTITGIYAWIFGPRRNWMDRASTAGILLFSFGESSRDTDCPLSRTADPASVPSLVRSFTSITTVPSLANHRVPPGSSATWDVVLHVTVNLGVRSSGAHVSEGL